MSSIDVNETSVVAHFDAMPAAVHDALLAKINALALILQTHIVQDKLSGQVLNVITGALRRSIFSDVNDDGTVIEGRAASSGDVKYAGIHEYGFSGDEQVKSHTRTIRQAFGKMISPKQIIIGEFTRHMEMPEKSFMRSSIADLHEKIIDGMKEAVMEGMRE